MKTKIEDFKIKMAEWLYDLSMCFSSEAKPLEVENIAAIVNIIVRLIEANQMTFDLEPYATSIKIIASGKVELYKFNVVNLMKVFNEQCDIYEKSKKPIKPEKW